MDNEIVISIINYRTGDLTVQCIQSVLADMQGIDGHIVVVDNNSGDGSAEKIESWIKDQVDSVPVTLVLSPTNSGFSGGHNLGISTRKADFYLVLNSDALVRRGFFKTILDAARSTPEAGLFSPKLQWEDGITQSSCFRFHSPLSELIRGANTGALTKIFKKHEVSLGPTPDIGRIQWASFACILLRAKMIKEIGEMDEGYFLYYEDSEYCLRAYKACWKLEYVPDAVAVHFRGGSGPVKALTASKKRLPKYYYTSRTRFLRQAHGNFGLLMANVLWLFGRGIAQLRRLVRKPVKPTASAEYRDIWTNFLTPLKPYKGLRD